MVFYAFLAFVWLRVVWLAYSQGGFYRTIYVVVAGLISTAALFAIRAFIRWRYRRKHTVFVEFVAPR